MMNEKIKCPCLAFSLPWLLLLLNLPSAHFSRYRPGIFLSIAVIMPVILMTLTVALMMNRYGDRVGGSVRSVRGVGGGGGEKELG